MFVGCHPPEDFTAGGAENHHIHHGYPSLPCAVLTLECFLEFLRSLLHCQNAVSCAFSCASLFLVYHLV